MKKFTAYNYTNGDEKIKCSYYLQDDGTIEICFNCYRWLDIPGVTCHNDSDSMTDYYEDTVGTVAPDSEAYPEIAAAYNTHAKIDYKKSLKRGYNRPLKLAGAEAEHTAEIVETLKNEVETAAKATKKAVKLDIISVFCFFFRKFDQYGYLKIIYKGVMYNWYKYSGVLEKNHGGKHGETVRGGERETLTAKCKELYTAILNGYKYNKLDGVIFLDATKELETAEPVDITVTYSGKMAEYLRAALGVDEPTENIAYSANETPTKPHGEYSSFDTCFNDQDSLSDERVTVDSLIERYNHADFNRRWDSYEIAGWILNDAKSTEYRIDAVEHFNKFHADKYSYEQAEEIRSLIRTALENGSTAKNIAYSANEPIEPPELLANVEPLEASAPATVTEITPHYFTISESTAKTAKSINSFDDYKPGSASASYREQVDEATEIARERATAHPECVEELQNLLDRYAAKLAMWENKYYSIEARCPSIMICGGGNFNNRKKEKQNNARAAHWNERKKVDYILQKIRKIGTGPIKSADKNALDKLNEKLDILRKYQERMKSANAYYRKNNTLIGFENMTAEQISEWKNSDYKINSNCAPFPAWALQNNNANIKRVEERVKTLEAAKAQPTAKASELENEFCKVVKNSDIMRLQLIFDGKPDDTTRETLKKNGFKWAPSQKAWQRQLTQNAEKAAEKVLETLRA